MRVAKVLATGNYEIQTEEIDPTDFGEWCRSVVGGYFEVIYLPKPGIDLWIDEEGKYKDYSTNEWATAACFHGGYPLHPTDFVMGNVVLTNGPDDEGELRGLTDEQLAWLRKVEI